MQSCLESDIGRKRTEGTGNMKIHLLHWGRVQAQKSIKRKEHHVRVNQPSRSSPTVASEEVQEASPKGCDSGMPQKTPGLPINRHFIITKAHCQYSTKKKKTIRTPSSDEHMEPFIPPTNRASPWQPVAHYSMSMPSASASGAPSAINLRKSSLAFSTAS
jgi:hypothetical protein